MILTNIGTRLGTAESPLELRIRIEELAHELADCLLVPVSERKKPHLRRLLVLLSKHAILRELRDVETEGDVSNGEIVG